MNITVDRAVIELALKAVEHFDDVDLNDAAITALRTALERPEQAWHFVDCEGECLACLIEREVKAAFGNQGLAYLLRHVGGQDE